MPPPAGTPDQWAACQATAVALNDVQEAARLHKLPYNAARMRASRERWPVHSRRASALKDARTMQADSVTTLPPRMLQRPTVTEAITEAEATTGKQTKAILSQKLLHSVTFFPDAINLDDMQSLKAAVQTGAILHGWSDQSKTGNTLNIVSDNVNIGLL